MPIYAACKTKSNGQFFLKCGGKEIAGRNSNITIENGENSTLVLDYGWNIQTSQSSGTSSRGGSISFALFLTVPAYQPTISSAFNVFNLNDEVEELMITIIDRASVGGLSSVIGTYTAKNGTLLAANMEQSHDSKDGGKLHLDYEFETIVHDNKVTNTTGIVKETSAF